MNAKPEPEVCFVQPPPRNPMQPVLKDQQGTLRFKQNAIVRYLLDNAKSVLRPETNGIDLNDLHELDFTDDDWMQFNQLIGYSLSGFGELSSTTDEAYEAAHLMSEGVSEKDAAIQAVQDKLKRVRDGMRDAVADLFSVHPDDLKT